eukprot:NODE_6369_length_514_cov_605.944086_g5560_i2.p1 GENE.NODE_6369_length_514_cov_605.944086_g5560_i2~~NODE_6369_length_514_cov_605.944086_g5560_i2.p1  ORF type:complete len:100 (-),score=18.46 NODE_6369_length_514_cov_605.944086_g5560_i2:4-303(-)
MMLPSGPECCQAVWDCRYVLWRCGCVRQLNWHRRSCSLDCIMMLCPATALRWVLAEILNSDECDRVHAFFLRSCSLALFVFTIINLSKKKKKKKKKTLR